MSELPLNDFEVQVLTLLGSPGAPLKSREAALQELRDLREAVQPGEYNTLTMAVVEALDEMHP